MFNFPTHKLCSRKLLGFVAIIIIMLVLFMMIFLIALDKLQGKDLVQLFRITMDISWKVFGIYVAGNWATKKYTSLNEDDFKKFKEMEGDFKNE